MRLKSLDWGAELSLNFGCIRRCPEMVAPYYPIIILDLGTPISTLDLTLLPQGDKLCLCVQVSAYKSAEQVAQPR